MKLGYLDVLTQLLTGARVSEIRGLVWENIIEEKCQIKFANNYISVKEYSLDEEGHIISKGRKSRYTTLKSSSSERIIEVSKELMEILKIHKKLQMYLAQRLNKDFKESDPVFTTSKYNQIGRNYTNDRVKKVVKDLEIPNWKEISSHCLRHSFCYAGILNDVPINYMSKLMGHSSVKVTEQYYVKYNQQKINHYARRTNINRDKALQTLNEKYGLF